MSEETVFMDLMTEARLERLPYCSGEQCMAYESCTYLSMDEEQGRARCEVMGIYLRSTASEIYNLFKNTLNKAQIFRIARHLLPLYKTLCRLQIDEIGVEVSLRTNKFGKVMMNPVYREIRETVKTIEGVWILIGIDKAPMPKPFASNMDEIEQSTSSTAMVRTQDQIEASLRRKLNRGKITKENHR